MQIRNISGLTILKYGTGYLNENFVRRNWFVLLEGFA